MTQIYLHGLGQTSTAWENTVMGLDSAENIVCPNLSDLLQGKEAAYLNLYSAFSNFCAGSSLCHRPSGKSSLSGSDCRAV